MDTSSTNSTVSSYTNYTNDVFDLSALSLSTKGGHIWIGRLQKTGITRFCTRSTPSLYHHPQYCTSSTPTPVSLCVFRRFSASCRRGEQRNIVWSYTEVCSESIQGPHSRSYDRCGRFNLCELQVRRYVFLSWLRHSFFSAVWILCL